jgi:excisionase family DNA binding protein
MSDRLLTTTEAAKFLRVSQASIRRWANEGLLKASRVGPRAARRFREADLVRFMGATPPDQVPPSGGTAPEIGLQGLTVKLGTHLASYFASDVGRLRLGTPFLRDGIQSGQACIVHAAQPAREHYLRALREHQVDVDAALETAQLRFMPLRRQSVDAFLSVFDRMVVEASERHPGPLRFLGEPAAGARSVGSVRALLKLEQELSMMVKRLPMVILCPYDVRDFDGVTMLEALKLHFDTFAHPLGYFLN